MIILLNSTDSGESYIASSPLRVPCLLIFHFGNNSVNALALFPQVHTLNVVPANGSYALFFDQIVRCIMLNPLFKKCVEDLSISQSIRNHLVSAFYIEYF